MELEGCKNHLISLFISLHYQLAQLVRWSFMMFTLSEILKP